jgi:hypothetical protein
MRLIIITLTLIFTPHLFAQSSVPALPQNDNANAQDDRVIAFNELKAKALTGDLESIYSLAQKYAVGENGVCDRNSKLSFDLFLYTANAGYKEAQGHMSIYYQNAADSKHNDPDLLAEAYKWSVISGTPFYGSISAATKAEGVRRANEFVVTTNAEPSEAVRKLNIPEKEVIVNRSIDRFSASKRARTFSSFEEFDTYRLAVCKDYIASFTVISNKLDKATPAELKVYLDSVKKLSELRRSAIAYLRFNPAKNNFNDVSLKGSETLRKELFAKKLAKLKATEIITDVTSPVTLEQIKGGKEFVEALKDLMVEKPAMYGSSSY